MISPAPPVSAPDPHPLQPGDRWRQSWLILLVAALVTLAITMVGGRFEPTPASSVASPVPSVPPSPSLSPSPSPSASPSAPPRVLESASASPSATSYFPASGVRQLAGSVPKRGSSQFAYGSTRSPVLGTRGPVRRFRVAVEKGSNEDVTAFGAQVQSILGDKRSWIGAGSFRLQMVTGADKSDFTVYLATRDTAGQMCLRGGTNIRVGGVPYTSCRAPGKAIINLDRWRRSAPTYVAAKIDLATYRQYVVNHEVGHEFGHRHEGCPKAGGPAPVMVQQTLTLRGCVPYAWPRRDSRSFTGPLL